MIYNLPVSVFKKNWNPLTTPPWGCDYITRREISAAILKARWILGQYNDIIIQSDGFWTKQDHIDRIATLAHFGWRKSLNIWVGDSRPLIWPIEDGNHRVAAAIFLKKETIRACISGDLEYASAIFGIDIPHAP